jgi:proline racemase
VDTAFGGDSFVIASAADLDVDVRADDARRLADIGRAICDAANAQWTFEHPTLPGWKHFSFAYLTGPLGEDDGALTSRNACAIKPGKIDRSPTGTGCSAFMAVLHDRGEMNVSDRYVGRSIIDSRFDCSIVEQVSVGDVPAIIPTVRGRAWVFGHSQYFRDPRDPWPSGYRISDTWPSP